MSETLTLERHPRNEKSRIRVLRGVDDGHDFAVVVPLRIKTVEDAIDWLRPDDVPRGAIRQGEFFFVPSAGPHYAARCNHPKDPDGKLYLADCGGYEHTDAGSEYTWTLDPNARFSRRHIADICYGVVKSGSVRFIGRRKVKSHSFTGRPRYFVKGTVRHVEHGDLVLPSGWHEVIPNKAHGPFPMAGPSGYAD